MKLFDKVMFGLAGIDLSAVAIAQFFWGDSTSAKLVLCVDTFAIGMLCLFLALSKGGKV